MTVYLVNATSIINKVQISIDKKGYQHRLHQFGSNKWEYYTHKCKTNIDVVFQLVGTFLHDKDIVTTDTTS